MKHTEVYGLRNRGTRDTIKGTLATMEAGGEDGHGIHSTPAGTPPPMDDVSALGKESDVKLIAIRVVWWSLVSCCCSFSGILRRSCINSHRPKRGVRVGRKTAHNQPLFFVSLGWAIFVHGCGFVAGVLDVSWDGDGRYGTLNAKSNLLMCV